MEKSFIKAITQTCRNISMCWSTYLQEKLFVSATTLPGLPIQQKLILIWIDEMRT